MPSLTACDAGSDSHHPIGNDAQKSARATIQTGPDCVSVVRRKSRTEPLDELLKTNDPVLISYVEALLDEAGIHYLVLDQHMSIMEGSLGFLPRRVMVPEASLDEARGLMREAGLAQELKSGEDTNG